MQKLLFKKKETPGIDYFLKALFLKILVDKDVLRKMLAAMIQVRKVNRTKVYTAKLESYAHNNSLVRTEVLTRMIANHTSQLSGKLHNTFIRL